MFDDFEMNEILNFLIKEKLTLINNNFFKNYKYYENLCNEKNQISCVFSLKYMEFNKSLRMKNNTLQFKKFLFIYLFIFVLHIIDISKL